MDDFKGVRKPKPIVHMQRVCVGSCEHTVTSRRIGNGWNVRILLNGEVNQETRVFARNQIGKVAKDMLRWEDKSGNISAFAGSARERLNSKT